MAVLGHTSRWPLLEAFRCWKGCHTRVPPRLPERTALLRGPPAPRVVRSWKRPRGVEGGRYLSV